MQYCIMKSIIIPGFQIDTKIKSAVYRRDLEVIVYYTDKEKLPVKNVYCCTSFDSI